MDTETALTTLVSYPKKQGVTTVRLDNQIVVGFFRGRGGPTLSLHFPSGRKIERVLDDNMVAFSGPSQWRSEQTWRLHPDAIPALAQRIDKLAQDPRSGVR